MKMAICSAGRALAPFIWVRALPGVQNARELSFAQDCRWREGLCFWDILSSNTAALSLAQELGFRLERRLMRMSQGAQLERVSALNFGIAGFELG